MTAPGRGAPALHGRSGGRSAQEMLGLFERLGVSGTLALSGRGGTHLFGLRDGERTARGSLGDPPELEATDVAFLLHEHIEADEPILPPAVAGARLDALRAWPMLGTETPLEPKPLDVASALERLRAASFSGVLGGAAGSDETAPRRGAPMGGAMVLLAGGIPVAAVAERAGDALQSGDALRALMRQAADAAAPSLYLAPLPPPLPAILAGLALGLEGDGREGLTGAAREGDDLVLLREGEVIVRLAGEGGSYVGAGLTRAAKDPARLRELPLPDDPPGFEERRYRLTLRGRDVLDPMTDLSMQFEAEIGASGKRLLRTLRRGLSVLEVGSELGLDLDQLRPWLRRLEEDGLIQPLEG